LHCTATPTTSYYPLSLHVALPISELARRIAEHLRERPVLVGAREAGVGPLARRDRCAAPIDDRAARAAVRRGDQARVEGIARELDRKSTRLNSSHEWTSYAVFCLK